jgi:hypothetical protein
MKKKMYQYKLFEAGLDAFAESVGRPATTRALQKLKFMVMATAWVDFQSWHPDVNKEQAFAWAWEDMNIAFCGYGDSGLTGAIVNFWTSVPEEHWARGKKALNKAGIEANEATPRTVTRRYLLLYRVQTVRTPDMGYDLPAIVPVIGPQLREWAVSVGMDPDSTEEQMSLIEEYERMGLIKLEQEDHFIVKGGEKLVAGSPAMANPEIVSRPKLHLVRGDE